MSILYFVIAAIIIGFTIYEINEGVIDGGAILEFTKLDFLDLFNFEIYRGERPLLFWTIVLLELAGAGALIWKGIIA